MGQKVNPIIFRINNKWNSKYFEKKITDLALLNFSEIEIRKFIYKFFKTNGLNIKNLKLSYINNKLNIFIRYYFSLKFIKINNNQKIKFKSIKKTHFKHNKKQIFRKVMKKKIYTLQKKISNIEKIKRYKKWIKKKIKNKKNFNFNKNTKIKKKIKGLKKKHLLNCFFYIKNYIKYKKISYFNTLKKTKKIIIAKNIINKNKKKFKLRRINFLKFYKDYTKLKYCKKLSEFNKKIFLNKFFEILKKFTHKLNISITLNKLNTTVKNIILKQKVKNLQIKLVKLSKYEKNNYFNHGVNILFLCATHKNSAKLLANFITFQLQKTKKHKFFLKFVKNTLSLFINNTFSKIKGIKIKIKGRINGAPRARHRFLLIGKRIPIFTIKSKIDYAESTSFTLDGTLGIKIWIY